MKKLLVIISVILCMLNLVSCSVEWTDKEIKNAKMVEITCYSNHTGGSSEVFTISDERQVGNICNTFSLLVVKKSKITEPTQMSYSIRFLDDKGTEIEVVNLIFGHDVIQNDGQTYKITDEMDINRYIKEDVLENRQTNID